MIRIPYGRGFLEWQPPEGADVTVVEKPEIPPILDPASVVARELLHPEGSPPLLTLAAGARSATVVVTDATRPCPDHLIVPEILRVLLGAGVPETGITILVAIGMHRPSTREEKIEKLSAGIVDRFRVVDSEPLDRDQQVGLGDILPGGAPARIDKRTVETDLLIATGIVEPHQYAGYSGGWKTVAIGTASGDTIGYLHGMRYLEDPAVRLANTKDNPFLESLRRIGRKVALRFVVNVALNASGEITRVLAGHPEAVHESLRKWVEELSVVPVDHPFRIVIGASGHPKDSNLYQATRIPTYLCFGRRPVVAEGGAVIVPAACGEGAGNGPGEKLFLDWLSRGLSVDEIVNRARVDGNRAGVQRAVMVAWAREHADIAFVGTACPDIVRRCGMEAFERIDEAVRWAREKTGDSRILVVPRALTTLPEVA